MSFKGRSFRSFIGSWIRLRSFGLGIIRKELNRKKEFGNIDFLYIKIDFFYIIFGVYNAFD